MTRTESANRKDALVHGKRGKNLISANFVTWNLFRPRSNSKERKKRRRSRSRDRSRERAREKERELEKQRYDLLKSWIEAILTLFRERRRRDESDRRRRDAERRRRMSPSPTFKSSSRRSPERRRSREEREKRFFLLNLSKTKIVFRRQERHKRKKSDVFKGTLSEGMNKRESSDEDLKDVEIPMDSDDEEAQIRKRREARQKMLQRLQTDENSPASSPATPGSPMLDRFKEKNRISQGFYSFDLICWRLFFRWTKIEILKLAHGILDQHRNKIRMKMKTGSMIFWQLRCGMIWKGSTMKIWNRRWKKNCSKISTKRLTPR